MQNMHVEEGTTGGERVTETGRGAAEREPEGAESPEPEQRVRS